MQKLSRKSLLDISENSKFITIYEFITILLTIGTGLGGLSEIAKNKVLGYSGFVVGGIGVIVLLLVIFAINYYKRTRTISLIFISFEGFISKTWILLPWV
jgi:hypothetical protein